MNYFALYSDLKSPAITTEEAKALIREKAIFITRDDVDFEDKIRVNDQFYAVVWMPSIPDEKDQYFFVEEYSFDNEDTLKIEDEITCPYCGTAFSDSWDFNEDDGEEVCETCGSTFTWTREYSVDYWSRPVEKHEEIKDVEVI